MTIQLTEAHVAWLRARVVDGTFSSLDEALAQIVDEKIALWDDDLAWARPEVDEARADVAAGRVMTISDHKARNASRRDKLGA